MKNITNTFKILSDETRLRIMLLLYRHDYCVCELSEILELPQPKTSKHLTKLRDLGFVSTRRDAQFIYYTLVNKDSTFVHIIELLEQQIKNHDVLYKDSLRAPSCKAVQISSRKEEQ